MAVIRQLTDLLSASPRASSERRIGLELERLALWPDGSPFRYSTAGNGKGSRPGAEALLRELGRRHGWAPLDSPTGQIIGLQPPTGGVTLEPGSQLEFSTLPEQDLFRVAERAAAFEAAVTEITEPWGLRWVALGLSPRHEADEIEVIPSPRYAIMTKYLGARGRLATTMMRLTTSVQINLDYSSEEEAIEMLRVALAASPLSYALFGNSPLFRGKETGYVSYRAKVWDETDPDRTGLLPFVFEKGFSFEKYAEYAARNPLMFALRDGGGYVEPDGLSLADIESGRVPHASPSEDNRLSALRQLFPEARLKPGYVEVRSVDGQRTADRYSAAAFWAGLLYHDRAREKALRLLVPLKHAGRAALREAAARNGLRGEAAGTRLRDLAEVLVEAAKEGLVARGKGEEKWLRPAERAVETGCCPADYVIQAFRQGGLAAVEASASLSEAEPPPASACYAP